MLSVGTPDEKVMKRIGSDKVGVSVFRAGVVLIDCRRKRTSNRCHAKSLNHYIK